MKKDSDIIDIETGSGKRNIVSAVSAAACLFVLLIIYLNDLIVVYIQTCLLNGYRAGG